MGIDGWVRWLFGNTEVVAIGLIFFAIVGDPGVDVHEIRYERRDQTLQQRRVPIQDELVS